MEPSILEPLGIAPQSSSQTDWAPEQTRYPHRWTALISLILFWLLMIFAVRSSLANTDGKLMYVLDDPYISAAMARNLLQHRTLGVTPYAYSSSSSSIIWPFLLAATDLVVRTYEYSPFILNALLGTFLIPFLYALLVRAQPRAPALYILIFLLLGILLTPLPALVFVGLEHILHIIAIIGLSRFAALSLSSPDPIATKSKAWAGTLLLASLATLVRYESLFTIAIIAMLLLLRRRWMHGLQFVVAGSLPVIVFGIYSRFMGWFFLPNSVLVKGQTATVIVHKLLAFWKTNGIIVPSAVQLLFVIAFSLLVAELWHERKFWGANQMLLLIFLLTTLIHYQVARIGGFYRYEAYLIALGLFAIFGVLYDCLGRVYLPRHRPVTLALCILVISILFYEGVLLLDRAIGGYTLIPSAARNIYQQHYQMARFLKKYYPHAVVAANDIGAINFFADIHCLDLYGLASVEVASLKRNQLYTTETISEYVAKNHGQIAIVYDSWYQEYGGLPPQWTRVGTWKIDGNVVAAEDTVSFYATNPYEQDPLIRHLSDFSSELPSQVHQGGWYAEMF